MPIFLLILYYRDIYAIQQKLTTISAGREVSLDHACQYFALMLLSGQDILNGIVENGPQFQQIDYKFVNCPLFSSKPGSECNVILSQNDSFLCFSNSMIDLEKLLWK